MVSSSTPGVLHTVIPRACAVGDVDVVVADGCVRHDAEPSRPSGLEHGRVDAVGQVADDAVEVRRQRRQLVGRQWGAVAAGSTIS